MGQLAALGAGGVATAFSPASVSGLYAWWKADSIAQSDNTAVTSWTDSSGNGHTITSATGQTFQTNELNGYPGVQFDGTDDIMTAGSWAADTSRTVIVVAKATAATSNRTVWAAHANARVRIGTASTWFWVQNQAAGTVDLGGTVTNATIITIAWSSNSAANGYLGSGSATAFDPENNIASSATMTIGATSAGLGFFPGFIYELIVYDSSLSDADRGLVVGHLQTKYGL